MEGQCHTSCYSLRGQKGPVFTPGFLPGHSLAYRPLLQRLAPAVQQVLASGAEGTIGCTPAFTAAVGTMAGTDVAAAAVICRLNEGYEKAGGGEGVAKGVNRQITGFELARGPGPGSASPPWSCPPLLASTNFDII